MTAEPQPQTNLKVKPKDNMNMKASLIFILTFEINYLALAELT